MIRYLIKNNFKLMFRNTWSIVVMLVGPILVIAILSSAFAELMKSYEGVDEFAVGYRVETDSPLTAYIDVIKEAGEESGITFYEYPEGEPKTVLENNSLAGFVEFSQEEYIVYQSADYEIEGITLEYFLSKVMNEGINTTLKMMAPTSDVEMNLPVEQLEFMPAIDSKAYYGIIYIVYFSWCGIICAVGVLSSEKKYGIERKYRVSNLSDFQLYFSRFVPISLTVSVGMGIAAFTTIWMYDIHWGNVFLSAFIAFMMILAGVAFGLMIYHIFDNLVITIIGVFTSVWFMGFFGGSFETYMFSPMPDVLKKLSPIYHGNRALVELSCMGQSEYVGSASIYMIVIIIVCSGVAVMASGIRKRGRA